MYTDMYKGSGTMVLQKSPAFIFKEVKGEAFLLNAATGDYFSLNPVGCDFLKLVDGRRTMGEIEDAMLALYDVEREELSSDIAALASEMRQAGILSEKDA
jgi:hypothetical protein